MGRRTDYCSVCAFMKGKPQFAYYLSGHLALTKAEREIMKRNMRWGQDDPDALFLAWDFAFSFRRGNLFSRVGLAWICLP
eukprot:m.124254 g.124254  ORF g.124254 m.124254 type:complete len:80 (-) comp19733_c0_seq1:693-932(-)